MTTVAPHPTATLGEFAGALGAIPTEGGTQFAIVSHVAERVDLCLFDAAGDERRVPLTRDDHAVWRAFVPGVGVGQRYGYRVHGPYRPHDGLRCNPAKLLLDPYTRAIDGVVDWRGPLWSDPRGSDADRPDERDSAPFVPKSVVVGDDRFDWRHDRPPAIPWNDTIIYELHVKGFTRQHPDVPPAVRGTFAGLGSEAAIAHLKELGVTAVELLPVFAWADEPWLTQRGLTNYWGYNPIAFFALEPRLCAATTPDGRIAEFKAMVRALHRADIEVILDVVYNHTAEGGALGPTLSLRGIDNAAYYLLDPSRPRDYLDFSGTGNTLNARHPTTLALILASLRYWVQEMHVDGFRFDLCSALARGPHGFDPASPFLAAVRADPVLASVKLIAEPWDAAAGGHAVGAYPAIWSEWNDKFRDQVRRFWRGDAGMVGDMGYRLTGSSDLFQTNDRTPSASINFVTCHDGFTLTDLVSYAQKHNLDNGEGNRDGASENFSANYGVEGPTEDQAILALRDRQRRNLLTTLLLATGTPMLLAGDEIGRTQGGNNNAYCHDTPRSWLDWGLHPWQERLLGFTKRLIALRRAQPAFRRNTFFRGCRDVACSAKDISWLRSDGQEMTDSDWGNRDNRALGVYYSPEASDARDETGRIVPGDPILLLLNAETRSVAFTLPPPTPGRRWSVVIDTARPLVTSEPVADQVVLTDRSTMALIQQPLAHG